MRSNNVFNVFSVNLILYIWITLFADLNCWNVHFVLHSFLTEGNYKIGRPYENYSNLLSNEAHIHSYSYLRITAANNI